MAPFTRRNFLSTTVGAIAATADRSTKAQSTPPANSFFNLLRTPDRATANDCNLHANIENKKGTPINSECP